MTWVLLVALYVAAGIAAGWDARRKGWDDRIFMIITVVLGPIALLGMWFLPPKALRIGQPVRPASTITLDDGRQLKPGFVTVVRDTAVVDGEPVCLITAPSGSRHWVAQEALSRVGQPRLPWRRED
ncbi:hypothetical protein FHX74_000794 [Friedmanniella endophytica]|uniref:Phospholipase_D-nuclease N-terminal n=1 Tax=Microlunatus kandeliicorticis TaxID=1759536 RepID=A0A7W3P4V1_9ACTN|nr:hypothetical protein [Microlunatus kandeliicorticis]MBA8793200.1 hypothetical protein [Microlunatus kandeliicorticis]